MGDQPLPPADTSRWSDSIQKIWSATLDLQPACLEFVPEIVEAVLPCHFVVGTYDLLEDEVSDISANTEESSSPAPQTRNGSLSLWRLSESEAHLEHRVPHPAGVFDLKFYSNTKNFAVAASNGTISMYRIQDNGPDDSQSIVHISTMTLFSPDVMVTSLAWQVKRSSLGLFPILAVTTSNPDQGVYVFFVSEDFITITQKPGVINSVENPEPYEAIKRHSDNVWTSSFANDFTLYSGGDDSMLKRSVLDNCIETGQYHEHALTKPAEFLVHGAGVTAILVLPFPPGPYGDHLLLTGSYDDQVRILSTNFLSSTKARRLAELQIGGCAWRLKLLDHEKTLSVEEPVRLRVLASCMHIGFKILELKGSWGGSWTIEVLAEVLEQKVLCYAADVQPMKGVGKRMILSSSFYQKKLSLWSWDPDVPRPS